MSKGVSKSEEIYVADGTAYVKKGAAGWEHGPVTDPEFADKVEDPIAALDAFRDYGDAVTLAKADGRVYERMATLDGDIATRVHSDVFRVGVVDGEYLSEDYWACDALRRLGFAIHVDPAMVVRHHGTVAV